MHDLSLDKISDNLSESSNVWLSEARENMKCDIDAEERRAVTHG